jgi:hypothetical protein
MKLPAYYNYVRVEAFTAVTMKKAVFWDVAGAKSQKTAFFILQLV